MSMDEKNLFYENKKYPGAKFVDFDVDMERDAEKRRAEVASRPYQVEREQEKADGIAAFARMTGRDPQDDNSAA